MREGYMVRFDDSRIPIPTIMATNLEIRLQPPSRAQEQPKDIAANERTSCYQIVCPRSGKALAKASSER